jgi:hypothetical protein
MEDEKLVNELIRKIWQSVNNRFAKNTAELLRNDIKWYTEQLNKPCVSNSLPDFRDVIEARIKHFNSNYHTYEGSDLQNALNTIRRLVPPILFQIGQ